jgi:hypothetical protein
VSLVSIENHTYIRMVAMQRAQEPSGKKIVMFAMTEESLETELVYWIRDLIKSFGKLIPTLERLQLCYRELREGEPVTDREVALREVEHALKAAEEFSLLGLAWFLERSRP